MLTDWLSAGSTVGSSAAGPRPRDARARARSTGKRLGDAVRAGEVAEAELDEHVDAPAAACSTASARSTTRPRLGEHVDRPARAPRAGARGGDRGDGAAAQRRRCCRSTVAAMRTLAVLGPNAERPQMMGGGSANLAPHYRDQPARRAARQARRRASTCASSGASTSTARTAPLVRAVRRSSTSPGRELARRAASARGTLPRRQAARRRPAARRASTSTNFSFRATATLRPRRDRHRTRSRSCRWRAAAGSCSTARSCSTASPTRPVPAPSSSGSAAPRRAATVELEAGQAGRGRGRVRRAPDAFFLRGHEARAAAGPSPPDLLDRAVAAAAGADAVDRDGRHQRRLGDRGRGPRPRWTCPGARTSSCARAVAANPNTVVVVNTGVAGHDALGRRRARDRAGVVRRPGDGATRSPTCCSATPSPAVGSRPRSRCGSSTTRRSATSPASSASCATARACSWATAGTRRATCRPGSRSVTACRTRRSRSASPTVADRRRRASPCRVPVTNTGDRRGAEVVQCYVAPPRRRRLVTRPPKELKAFAKVRLDPGESTTVELTPRRARVRVLGPASRPRRLARRSRHLRAARRPVVGRHRARVS